MAISPISRRPDHTLPAGTPDVRSWEVRSAVDDERVGTVDDILVDDERDDARFLDVDLGPLHGHRLLPARRTRPDGERRILWVDGLARDDLENAPKYALDGDVVPADHVRRAEAAYDAASERRAAESREAARTPAGRPAATGVPGDSPARLARLDDLDEYRVAGGDADPRGWKLVTIEAKPVGKVAELLVDIEERRVRYLDCDLDEKTLRLEPLDRHVLIPVERVRLDPRHHRVVVDGLLERDLRDYPVYGGLPLRGEDAARIRAAFEDDGAGDAIRRREEVQAAPRREETAVEEPASDERRRVEAVQLRGEGEEVRIHLSGDDIVIEKRPRT